MLDFAGIGYELPSSLILIEENIEPGRGAIRPRFEEAWRDAFGDDSS